MTPVSSNPFSDVLLQALGFAWVLFIIIAPIALGILCFQAYVTLRRNQFIASQEKVLLEIRLPKQIPKSPLAMELFLTGLYQTKGESTWISRYIEGKVRPWFSLELRSEGGRVHFYVWTWKFWKHLVESQAYAQFPDVEIKEVPDCTDGIHFDPDALDLFGCNFKLEKPDHFPILTYVNYKLDKDPDEEVKVDPMTPVLEYLGGLRDGEEAWIQIIIRAHKKERPNPDANFFDALFDKVDYRYAAQKEIKNIKSKGTEKLGEIIIEAGSLTKGDKDIIEAIERNVSKISFDTGIRAIYIARKDAFTDINVAGLTGSFRQYNSAYLNSFAPDHETSFNYPWQDITGKRLLHRKEHTLHAYQTRHFFHKPEPGHFFTLSTEELATIFHFPGEVAKTPTLGRVEAKRSEAPINLPI